MSLAIRSSTVPVPGFHFAGSSVGIKKTRALDLAIAVSDAPAAAGGVFTTNLVRAAPVIVAAERVRRGVARAVIANSGCANACTGEAGLEATRVTTSALARAIGVSDDAVLPASTGVIGALLPSAKIVDAVPSIVADLSPDGADRFAEAILTTDRGPKVVHARGQIDGRPFTVLAMAKGAGMIHPSMAPHATMLCFLFTDAAAGGAALTRALGRVADATFNQASVDGDTSTNDTLVALASGTATTAPGAAGEIPGALEEAFVAVCEDLARKMVADGEGAEHLVEITVSGVATDDGARQIARTIATSLLVKTALFGMDPNWGRLLGAAGRAGVAFDPSLATISVGGVAIVDRGRGLGEAREAEARAIMASPSYGIGLVLGDGPGRGRFLMCDLGMGYVRCNAGYRS
jgi:glutamate N-acetyltransferase / amino-acid N-acetyltransferase